MQKRLIGTTLVTALLLANQAFGGTAVVKVIDKKTDTAGSMLAYTEFELSGEPLAEALGLDLDVLDPSITNTPTAFDYTAGIESYEYSEEAMYALDYQSKMGPHLMNGPVNKMRGGSPMDLGKRFLNFAKAVSFPASELPLNMYPISIPYRAGVPEYAQKVDVSSVNGDEIIVLTKHGKEKTIKTVVPAYFRDYKTLAWKESSMDKSFTPAAAGGILLKEIMWSQDFLGGMHTIEGDEEVEAESSKMDQDGVHALGVSSADGFNGMVLTEIAWDKLLLMQEQLAFDGKKLGARITPQYNAVKNPIWFPHQVKVTEAMRNGVKTIGKLTVVDKASTLRDSWMMLWPLSEFYAYTDQRKANTVQNPAFLAVFDGAPFPAAPKVNTDGYTNNDRVGTDPFSIVSNLAGFTFKNLQALHFNAAEGTLVDHYDGKKGKIVTTYDAAYSLVALRIFQRAQDALPVGYGSDDSSTGLGTQMGFNALKMIQAQADFLLRKQQISINGLLSDSYKLGGHPSIEKSVGTQFAGVRGFTAAFLATKDVKYKQAARKLYQAIEKNMFDAATGTYADKPGQPTEYTSYTMAAISGGLRDVMLNLKNEEGENVATLELSHLTERYTSWFQITVNGRNVNEGMQLAEWLADTGENMVRGSSSVDTDEDGVPQVTGAGGKYGLAPTMAGKVVIYPALSGLAKK